MNNVRSYEKDTKYGRNWNRTGKIDTIERERRKELGKNSEKYGLGQRGE